MRVFTVQDTLIASSSSKPMMRSVVTQEKELAGIETISGTVF